MYSSWVDPQYLTMDITQIYAIVIAGVALVFLLRTGVSCLAPNLIATSSHVYQYLSHSYVLNRHTLIGPWTGAGVLLHLIYLAVNAVCLSVGVTNLSHAGRRAGTLAVINLGLLLSGLHLNFLADLLGLSVAAIRVIHRSAGLVAFGFAVFHVVVAAITERLAFVREFEKPFVIIVSSSLSAHLRLLTYLGGVDSLYPHNHPTVPCPETVL